MTSHICGENQYPDADLSVSQLLDAAKRKLRGPLFDWRFVNRNHSSGSGLKLKFCRIEPATMDSSEVR